MEQLFEDDEGPSDPATVTSRRQLQGVIPVALEAQAAKHPPTLLQHLGGGVVSIDQLQQSP
jgi:hypothetical protein